MVAVVGTYYLTACLIFPEVPTEWPDFDDHYDRQNRAVIGGLLLANFGSVIGQLVLEEIRPSPTQQWSDEAIMADGIIGLGILAFLIALAFVRNRRANLTILIVLVALQLAAAIADATL